MANQDAAFGLRPLKTIGQQDDSTGFSSYWIDAGEGSVMYQGSLVGSPATGTGYVDIQTAGLVLNLGAFWGCFYNDPTTLKPTFKNYYPGSITPPNSKDIEAFVFHSPHIEMGNGDDHINIKVIFTSINFFIPLHGPL